MVFPPIIHNKKHIQITSWNLIKFKGDDEPINDIEEKFEFYKDFIQNNFNEDFNDAPPSELSCQNEDIFLVMWSSGTTGIPKGTVYILGQ